MAVQTKLVLDTTDSERKIKRLDKQLEAILKDAKLDIDIDTASVDELRSAFQNLGADEIQKIQKLLGNTDLAIRDAALETKRWGEALKGVNNIKLGSGLAGGLDGLKGKLSDTEAASDKLVSSLGGKLPASAQNAVSSLGGLGPAGLAAAAGFLAITASVGGAIAGFTQLVSLGGQFAAGTGAIVQATGATGAELQALDDVATGLFTTLPVTFAEAGELVGVLNSQLQLTGDEAEDLGTKFIQLGNNLNIDDTAEFAREAIRLFEGAGAQAEDFSGILEIVQDVAQSSGAPIGELFSEFENLSSALAILGLDAGEAFTAIGQLRSLGIDTGLLEDAAGIGVSLDDIKTAIDGIGSADGIKNALLDLGLAETDATRFANAVATGKLELEALGNVSLASVQGSINDVFNNSNSLAEKWQVLTNVLANEFRPAAEAALGAVKDAIPEIQAAIQEIDFEQLTEQIVTVIDLLAENAPEIIRFITDLVADSVNVIGGFIDFSISAIGDVADIAATVIGAVNDADRFLEDKLGFGGPNEGAVQLEDNLRGVSSRIAAVREGINATKDAVNAAKDIEFNITLNNQLDGVDPILARLQGTANRASIGIPLKPVVETEAFKTRFDQLTALAKSAFGDPASAALQASLGPDAVFNTEDYLAAWVEITEAIRNYNANLLLIETENLIPDDFEEQWAEILSGAGENAPQVVQDFIDAFTSGGPEAVEAFLGPLAAGIANLDIAAALAAAASAGGKIPVEFLTKLDKTALDALKNQPGIPIDILAQISALQLQQQVNDNELTADVNLGIGTIEPVPQQEGTVFLDPLVDDIPDQTANVVLIPNLAQFQLALDEATFVVEPVIVTNVEGGVSFFSEGASTTQVAHQATLTSFGGQLGVFGESYRGPEAHVRNDLGEAIVGPYHAPNLTFSRLDSIGVAEEIAPMVMAKYGNPLQAFNVGRPEVMQRQLAIVSGGTADNTAVVEQLERMNTRLNSIDGNTGINAREAANVADEVAAGNRRRRNRTVGRLK